MIEIGAGGGSIAGIDRLRRITIGPESAGAEPGPAGFNCGGTRATVTDADLTLGYIDPDFFAENHITLDRQLADHVITETIGHPLNLNTTDAAYGISQIVDENMASAGRMHAVESGMNLKYTDHDRLWRQRATACNTCCTSLRYQAYHHSG